MYVSSGQTLGEQVLEVSQIYRASANTVVPPFLSEARWLSGVHSAVGKPQVPSEWTEVKLSALNRIPCYQEVLAARVCCGRGICTGPAWYQRWVYSGGCKYCCGSWLVGKKFKHIPGGGGEYASLPGIIHSMKLGGWSTKHQQGWRLIGGWCHMTSQPCGQLGPVGDWGGGGGRAVGSWEGLVRRLGLIQGIHAPPVTSLQGRPKY